MSRVWSLDAMLQMPAAESGPGEENGEELRRLKRALREAVGEALTARQRECLECYYYRGLTMRETADLLGVGEPTVSKHLKKARQRLRAVLRYAFRRGPD